MAGKAEMAEVIYCDTCGVSNRETRRMFLQCQKCDRDLCSQHCHIVQLGELSGVDESMYLCEECWRNLKAELEPILQRFLKQR